MGPSATSTAWKRSAVSRLQSSAARVSQFSAHGAARASAASSGPATSSAGRPARSAAMPARNRERLGRGARDRARREPLENGRDPRRASRVVKPGDDELTLEAGREPRLRLAELGERPLEHVDRLDPAEQRRVRPRRPPRDLRPLHAGRRPAPAPPRAARTPSPARRRLGAGGLAQEPDPLAGGGGSASARREQLGRRLRRAAIDRRQGRLAQALYDPEVPGGPYAAPGGRRPVRAARARGGAGAPPCGPRRRARPVRVRPRLPRAMTGWRKRGGSSPARTSRRTRPAVSRAASGISRSAIAAACRSWQPSPRIASAWARASACGSSRRTRVDHLPDDPLGTAGERLGGHELPRRRAAELERAQQFRR